VLPARGAWLRSRMDGARGGQTCGGGSSSAGSAATSGMCKLEPLLAERSPHAKALHAYQTHLHSALSYMRVPAMSANDMGGSLQHAAVQYNTLNLAVAARTAGPRELCKHAGAAAHLSLCAVAPPGRLLPATVRGDIQPPVLGPTWRACSSRCAAARRSRAVAPAGSTPPAAPPQQRPCGQQHTGSCPRARSAPKDWRLKVDAHCSR